MTTETPTIPAATDNVAPSVAATPVATGNTYSVVGLVLSILSFPTGLAVFAIAGIVLGFIGRSKEPAAATTSNWAIIVGFISLFGWVIVAMIGLAFLIPLAFWGAWAY